MHQVFRYFATDDKIELKLKIFESIYENKAKADELIHKIAKFCKFVDEAKATYKLFHRIL